MHNWQTCSLMFCLSTGMADISHRVVELQLPASEHDAFEGMLRCVYSGELDQDCPHELLKLVMKLSDRFLFLDLLRLCGREILHRAEREHIKEYRITVEVVRYFLPQFNCLFVGGEFVLDKF